MPRVVVDLRVVKGFAGLPTPRERRPGPDRERRPSRIASAGEVASGAGQLARI